VERLRVTLSTPRHSYEIKVGSNVLPSLGHNARDWLGKDAHRVAVISNNTVFDLYGQQSLHSLKTAGFAPLELIVSDGETAKSLTTIQKTLESLSIQRFERSDGIIALGGGVVGDLAGFTAAIYMRGIPFIQVPTTLLAQIDSSVGGKTGVNLPTGKNLIGAFHQPAGVLTDVNTLRTLPRRELSSGLFECVKQGVISGERLFSQTLRFLDAMDTSRLENSASQLEKLVAAHCKFKASIVRQDEREQRSRTDRRSRRILNFGHTTGHALEAVTRYRRFKHGEAVGLGLIVASQLSKDLGMLSAAELESILEAVGKCGPLPATDDLDATAIVKAISQDKKRNAGSVQWVLLEGIGNPRIVSETEIPPRLIRQALRRALKSSN
jgi:3-dehydroquinate synthase